MYAIKHHNGSWFVGFARQGVTQWEYLGTCPTVVLYETYELALDAIGEMSKKDEAVSIIVELMEV